HAHENMRRTWWHLQRATLRHQSAVNHLSMGGQQERWRRICFRCRQQHLLRREDHESRDSASAAELQRLSLSRARFGAGVNLTSSSVTVKVSRAVLYVKANATGANYGTTWANAFTDLQSALAVAAPCSQIWVAAGTYYPSTTDANISFQMKPDI